MSNGEITIRQVARLYNKRHGQSLSFERYRQIINTAHRHLKKLLLENPKTKDLIPDAL